MADDARKKQDERVKAATKERMQAEIAETKRQQAIWAKRPDKKGGK